MEKSCSRCEQNLPVSEFHRDKNRLDGLYPYCKDCRRAYAGSSQQQARDVSGEMFGKLLVLGRANKPYHFTVKCKCGTVKDVYGPSLWRTDKNRITSCGTGDCKLRSEAPTYNAIHIRIRKRRGTASKHLCQSCGAKAVHWAYDHTDKNFLTEIVCGSEINYSGDYNNYIPLCAKCHKLMDMQKIRERVGTS